MGANAAATPASQQRWLVARTEGVTKMYYSSKIAKRFAASVGWSPEVDDAHEFLSEFAAREWLDTIPATESVDCKVEGIPHG